MASRYPSVKVSSYCFNPRHIIDNDKDILVPCGKCDGCLLHKANDWSMRLTNEIEFNRFNIFFTLTYDNYYLPKLYSSVLDCPDLYIGMHGCNWISDHYFNIRFDGTKNVLRKDNIILSGKINDSINIQNFALDGFVPYSSKRDIQLWLKLIRKDLYEKDEFSKKDKYFRYYIISEYGPTTLRPHYHGIIFCNEEEIANYLLNVGLFKSWQMCDKDLFDQYTRFCDSGTAGYLTNYVTGFSSLPSILRNDAVRSFRLASKNPSIGYSSFDSVEVSQKISQRVIEYIRDVPRIESKYLLRFPKGYMRSLFPKCYQYSKLTDRRIYEIYSACYLDAKRRETKDNSRVEFSRLRSFMHPMNYNASLKCYKFCLYYEKATGVVCTPDYYLWCLDMYYYKEAMFSLESFYKSLDGKTPIEIAYSYDNFGYLLSFRGQSESLDFALELFIYSLGLQFNDFDRVDKRLLLANYVPNDVYESEVHDIIANSVKISKFNEKVGAMPHIV